ncbi:MAG: hypothetical protein C0485_16525 [Pirellula sp.]|nr:hypothetical protein [Pirellula sp.]
MGVDRKLSKCLALALFALAGCGSSEPFDYVPVSGKVTYEDGSLIPVRVRVIFTSQQPPVDGKRFPRPASALPDDQGYFPVVSSLRYDDGIVPGKNKVSIIYEGKQPERFVPREYSSPATTPLEVDSEDSPFEIKIKKPDNVPQQAPAEQDALSSGSARK